MFLYFKGFWAIYLHKNYINFYSHLSPYTIVDFKNVVKPIVKKASHCFGYIFLATDAVELILKYLLTIYSYFVTCFFTFFAHFFL